MFFILQDGRKKTPSFSPYYNFCMKRKVFKIMHLFPFNSLRSILPIEAFNIYWQSTCA